MNKPILCLDFDGVCHAYSSGWQGADVIADGAVPGLFEFIQNTAPFFTIQVYSSRSNQPGGIQAMQTWFMEQYRVWLDKNKVEKSTLPITFPKEKPAAFVTIDDRAITFTGLWPDLETLRKFQPWNKR